MRASSVVNRQSTDHLSALRRVCQAATSRTMVSRLGMRRARHWRIRTLILISAVFSQDPYVNQ